MSIFLVQNGVLVAASSEEIETLEFGGDFNVFDWELDPHMLAVAVWKPVSPRAQNLGFLYRLDATYLDDAAVDIYVRDFPEYLAVMRMLSGHILGLLSGQLDRLNRDEAY